MRTAVLAKTARGAIAGGFALLALCAALQSAHGARTRQATRPMKAPLTPADKARVKVEPISQRVAGTRHRAAIDLVLEGREEKALARLVSLQTALQGTAQVSPKDSAWALEELDRTYLSAGRVLFQMGRLKAASEAYMKVRVGSPSWFESLEERSWTHMKMNQPDQALALLKTILSPLFKDRDVSEPYFLQALAHLRTCDYSAIFKTTQLFKERFLDKVKRWEASQDATSLAKLRMVNESVQKMNLVEAEAIQHLYVDPNGRRLGGGRPKVDKRSDQLSFPHQESSEEVWLDEVNDFRVGVKGCQGPGGSSLADGSQARKDAGNGGAL